jgi:hypothetical protein
MIFCSTAQVTNELVHNFSPRKRELSSLGEAHLTTLYLTRSIVRLELLGTQGVVSMTPKSLQQKEDDGPGVRQSPNFGVPDDVEKIAEQDL